MRRAACALALGILGCAAAGPMPTARMAEADKLLRQSNERTGNLRLSCSPHDAVVAIDGVSVGLCSDFTGRQGMDVRKGARHLAVKKVGYLPYESFIDTDGTRVSLTISLAPSSLEGNNP
jgi:hypothetical protein